MACIMEKMDWDEQFETEKAVDSLALYDIKSHFQANIANEFLYDPN